MTNHHAHRQVSICHGIARPSISNVSLQLPWQLQKHSLETVRRVGTEADRGRGYRDHDPEPVGRDDVHFRFRRDP